MKSYIKIALVALTATSVFTACSFLDSDNKSTVSADKQFENATGWNQLLNQAYYLMRDIYSSPMLFCGGTDMYTASQGSAKSTIQTYQFNADLAEAQSLYQNTYAALNMANGVIRYSSDDKLNDEARFIRNYCYYILTQQFGAVPYIDKYIESAETSYPRTELKTIYDNMITDLKDIIACNRLAAEPDPANGRGRANMLAVKALLAKVCLAAGWDLDTQLNDAAQGSYEVKNKSYFEEAAKYAEEVIAAVPLSQTFEAKWDFDNNENATNIENLFSIQYNRATSTNQSNGGHSQQHYFGGYMGSNTLGLKALRNDLCPTERVYYAFDKNDDRYEASFMTTIYGWDGNEDNWSKQGYWGFYNTKEAEKAALSVAWKFFPWYATDAEIEAYCTANAAKFVTTGQKSTTKVIHIADQLKCRAYTAAGEVDPTASANNTMIFSDAIKKIGLLAPCRKFDDKNTGSTVAQSGGCYRDIILLNASEIYLCAAEAYLMMEQKDNAVAKLNLVRQRANAQTLTSLSDYTRYDWGADAYIKVGQTDEYGITINELDVILDERMRETLGEYYRWMDLRRTKQLVRYNIAYNEMTVASMSGNDGNIKWLRPIPTNEIQINSGISKENQNPGY